MSVIELIILSLGYGDVYPVTWEGKLFFIFYALIAIPMMLILLATCGDLLTSLNKKFYKTITRPCPALNQRLSPLSLSTLTMIILMIGYVHIAVGTTMLENDWSYIDALYFWMVTLTTVGFGDLNLPLEEQGIYFPYRVVGLALLAGVVDSLTSWIRSRKKHFNRLATMAKNMPLNEIFCSEDVNRNVVSNKTITMPDSAI